MCVFEFHYLILICFYFLQRKRLTWRSPATAKTLAALAETRKRNYHFQSFGNAELKNGKNLNFFRLRCLLLELFVQFLKNLLKKLN